MTQHANSGKFQELKLKYDKTKNEKVELIERLVRALQQNPNEEHLAEFRTTVHNIGGSAGSYGYTSVSNICKEMDSQAYERLDLKANLDKHWLSSLDHFLEKIRSGFQEPSFKEAQLNELRTFINPPLLYIIDGNKRFLSHLKQIQDQYLMDIELESEPEKALEKLRNINFKPDVIIVSQKFENSSLTAYDFVKSVQAKIQQHPALSVLLIEDDSLQQREDAARKGFNYVLKTPVSANIFFKTIKEALHREVLKGFRVLILDDDPDFCEYVSGVLSENHITVKAINNSDSLFSILEDYKPHVLLLDLVLPKYDGLKLLKALRHDAMLTHLIIIVVTSSEEVNTRLEAYSAKADDILYKPIDPELLKRRIFYLAERYALVGNEQQIIPKAEKAVVEDCEEHQRNIEKVFVRPQTGPSKKEVFLIDPDEGLIRILKTAFEARGVNVRGFKEGREALGELLNESRGHFPALIVAERKLPDMDGLDLFKKLQASPQKNIPFYFLTVFSSDKDVSEGLSLGVTEYIGKPFNVSIFMQKALKDILQHA